jgi:hypothetical protein
MDQISLDSEECRSLGMLRRVALVRPYVSEEFSASIIMVTILGQLGTFFAACVGC